MMQAAARDPQAAIGTGTGSKRMPRQIPYIIANEGLRAVQLLWHAQHPESLL